MRVRVCLDSLPVTLCFVEGIGLYITAWWVNGNLLVCIHVGERYCACDNVYMCDCGVCVCVSISACACVPGCLCMLTWGQETPHQGLSARNIPEGVRGRACDTLPVRGSPSLTELPVPCLVPSVWVSYLRNDLKKTNRGHKILGLSNSNVTQALRGDQEKKVWCPRRKEDL